jgi:hypothetical protein
MSTTLSIQTHPGLGLVVLLLAAHGLLELELNMTTVSRYFLMPSFFLCHLYSFDQCCCYVVLIFTFVLNMQIQINPEKHKCPSTERVESKMSNIGWVA